MLTHLLDRLLDVGVLLEQRLVQCGPVITGGDRRAAVICVVGRLGRVPDGLSVEHAGVSS